MEKSEKTKGNTNVSRCIDGTPILQDNVKMFDRIYKEVLDKSEYQAHYIYIYIYIYILPLILCYVGLNFPFSLKDYDVANE